MLSMLNDLGVGAAVWDGSGRVLMADDAYLALLGWARDKIGAMTRELTHPDDRVRNLLLLDQQKRDGKAFEITKRYIRASGELMWVQNRVSRLTGTDSSGVLVLSRHLPEDQGAADSTKTGRMAFAGVVSETTFSLGVQARRFSLPQTAALLERAADTVIPEAEV